MSTVDVVTFAGGRPANFCDLGGGGDAQGVVDALSVITRDPQVKAIFFNIFGGITRCDEVARGILQALARDGARAADRRPPRRHQRRRGPSDPRRRRSARTCTSRPTMLEAATLRRGAGGMTDVWSERAELYRTSDAHREGPDLDLSSSGRQGARTALDVATGGGHVARRLREAGLEVVTCDPAPGMQPRRRLPGRGTCRSPTAASTSSPAARAAHHFDDVRQAVGEMARVAPTACCSSTRVTWARTSSRPRSCATLARPQLQRGRVARLPRGGRAARREVRVLRARRWSCSLARPLRAARARRPSA